MNSLTIAGKITRLGQLVQLGDTHSVRFSVAVWNHDDRGSERKTDYVDVNCWRDLARNVAMSLEVGDLVVATGRLQRRRYTKDGRDHLVYELVADHVGPSLRSTSVRVDRVVRIGGKEGGEACAD